MKKTIFILMISLITSGAFAQAWAERWEWPLVAEYQSFNVGNTSPAESTEGSIYWPSTDKLNDPWKAARDGTLTIEDYFLLGRKYDSNK